MDEIKILLVEDEKKIANALKAGLNEQGYDVLVAYDGTSGQELFSNNNFDLVILDISLPGIDGYTLSRIIRGKNKDIPILMLTALGTIDDKVTGFEAGADDYLVKPFAYKELLARIKSLLRRTMDGSSAANFLRIADLELNLDSKEVMRSGKKIFLTVKEFQLLEYLIKNKNKVVTRSDIAGQVWGISFDTRTNVVDVYINFLRKKVDKDFSHKLIYTQVGIGYIIKDDQTSP